MTLAVISPAKNASTPEITVPLMLPLTMASSPTVTPLSKKVLPRTVKSPLMVWSPEKLRFCALSVSTLIVLASIKSPVIVAPERWV